MVYFCFETTVTDLMRVFFRIFNKRLIISVDFRSGMPPKFNSKRPNQDIRLFSTDSDQKEKPRTFRCDPGPPGCNVVIKQEPGGVDLNEFVEQNVALAVKVESDSNMIDTGSCKNRYAIFNFVYIN
jgi:hypothetical protein